MYLVVCYGFVKLSDVCRLFLTLVAQGSDLPGHSFPKFEIAGKLSEVIFTFVVALTLWRLTESKPEKNTPDTKISNLQ